MADVVRDALTEMLAEQIPQPALPVAASGFGRDLVCFDDFTPGLDETDPTTDASLAQDNYHRLITAPGTLPDDLDYGKDLLGYLSQGTAPSDILLIQGDIETELLKDDRNAEVSATVTAGGNPLTLSVKVVCTPADPDTEAFTLIINVDNSGVFLQAIL